MKQIVGVVVVVLVAAGAWWFLAKGPMGVATAPTDNDQHILQGTPAGSDYKYTLTNPSYEIEAIWPQKVPLPTAEASTKARLALEQALLDRMNVFKSNVQEMLTPQEVQRLKDSDRMYSFGMDYKAYTASGYVSYLYGIYEDTGGAHPNSYFMSVVFDNNGNTVTLASLFPSDTKRTYLTKIAAAAQKQVIAQLIEKLGVTPNEASNSYYSEGVSADAENFSSFVVDGDTLAIFIPPYQAAAYAAGNFEVRIPFSELK
jgi:hypothetical protein